MFPVYGKLWRSKRQANSSTMTFIVSSIFWVSCILITFSSIPFIPGFIKAASQFDKIKTAENNSAIAVDKSKDYSVYQEDGKQPESALLILMNNDLNVTCYRNGDHLIYASSKTEWQSANKNQIGVWCYYDNNPENGMLYNIYAINDQRGLAPAGFHIPSEYEWKQIIKEDNYTQLLNSPGGSRKSNGGFHKYGKIAYYWIGNDQGNNKNIAFDLRKKDFTHEGDLIENTGEGFSVRCIRD